MRRHARLVVEKLPGRDRKSAAALSKVIDRYFSEANVFRIDHYLARSPCRTSSTRASLTRCSSRFNRDHVRCIQIMMAENSGAGSRQVLRRRAPSATSSRTMLQVLATLTMTR
jgi:glucose-6-phosphate 1-dehydrogenase